MPVIDPLDHKMISDPSLWPSWPFLPMKKGSSSLQDKTLGALFGQAKQKDGKVTIYHANMFNWPKGEDAKNIPETKYDSVDAMLADGWIID